MSESLAINLSNYVRDEFYGGMDKYLSNEYKRKSKNIYDKQVYYENQYMMENRICHTDGHNSLLGISVSEITGINKDFIIDNLKNNFGNYTLMEEIRCIINTIIDVKDGDTKSERERIHHFMSDPKRFGAESAYNFALKSDFTSNSQIYDKSYHKFNSDTVVIKCPREPVNIKELIHELVIGIGALNKLRVWIPNFSYVYDAFFCSAPVINDENKEVLSWCMNTGSPVSYVIYENIQDSVSFDDFIDGRTQNNDFLMYLGQISLSLYLAEYKYGFAHCDCHTGNVLLRNFYEKDFYIKYYFDGNEYYLPCPGKIATFIDYGMSHAVLDDEFNIGKLDVTGKYSNIGIPTNDGTAISDIHKFLCFCLRLSIGKHNEQLYIMLSQILGGYFYNNINISYDEIMYILNEQWNCRYHVPPEIVRKLEWNMKDFILFLDKYTKNTYDFNLLNESVPEGFKMFNEFNYLSKSINKVKEEIGIEISEIPTLFDYYEATESKKDLIKNRIDNNLNLVISNENDEIDHKLSYTDQLAFYVITNEEILDLEYAIASIDNLSKIVDITFELYEKIKLYKSVGSAFNIVELNEKVKLKFRNKKEYISLIKDTLFNNFRLIKIFIFGEEKNGPLTETELSNISGNKYYNLYNKYNTTIDTMLKFYS